MGFLAPSLLWGLVAAGIPIALHFFYRSRFRTVPWAAMSFLLTSIEQTSRRLRFQELLLLALRVLVLFVLALALSRPIAQYVGQGAHGDAVDAVLILDTSLSMGAKAGVAPPATGGRDAYLDSLRTFAKKDGSVTRFDRARAAALAVVANLPPNSTVQVVTVTGAGRPATNLGPRAPSQLDQARTLIENLERTDTSTDLLAAFRLASEIAQRLVADKEVYLFSDMQKLGFDAAGPTLGSALSDLRGRAAVHLVHCAQGPVANVSVAGITPQSTLHPGVRANFVVLLRNRSSKPARNLTVSLEIDSKKEERESQPVELVRPNETRAVLLSGVLDKPGLHHLTATVQNDDLEADNTFTSVVGVREALGVLLVDGKPNPRIAKDAASYYLQHALNPASADAGDPLPLTVVPAGSVEPRHLAGKNLCILVNASLSVGPDEGGLSGDFVRALGPFIQERNHLMIFAGDRVEPKAYNTKLHDELRLLPFRIKGVVANSREKAWHFDRASAARVPFERFAEEAGYASLDRIAIRQALLLDEKSAADQAALKGDARVLLRYSNKAPAIASWQRPGQGEVVLFTTAVNDEKWTDLYLMPAFVPLVQVTLNHLLEARPELYNLRAGDNIVWAPPSADASRAFDLIRPDGRKVRLGFPDTTSGRPLLTTSTARKQPKDEEKADNSDQPLPPATGQAGLYRIAPADGSTAGLPFALSPDPTETADLTSLEASEIDGRLGVRLAHLTAGDEEAAFSGAERLSREWTLWLLGALLCLVVLEAWLAWFCGRPLSGQPS